MKKKNKQRYQLVTNIIIKVVNVHNLNMYGTYTLYSEVKLPDSAQVCKKKLYHMFGSEKTYNSVDLYYILHDLKFRFV